MDHNIRVDGRAYRLRPLRVDDAEFVVQLRTDPVLCKYIHATSPSLDAQRQWTQRYLQRADEWYFIVERISNNRPEGTICIYNVDRTGSEVRAEWGRWVMRRDSLGATEAACHIYDIGFDQLNIDLLYCHTESQNLPVVSFHDSMGLKYSGEVVGPEGEHWTEQIMTKAMWAARRTEVWTKAERMAKMLDRT